MQSKLKVLFLCTGNSCRSQMAEGWARHLKGDLIEPYSAGTHPGRLDPRAAAVMGEAGVAIGHQMPKSVDELAEVSFDLVVTVCDAAHDNCPVFPGTAEIVHRGFDDPPRLAAAALSEVEALAHYRRIRDEIRSFVDSLPESIMRAEELQP